jgi:uncharacterized membrane protein (GlpM family)
VDVETRTDDTASGQSTTNDGTKDRREIFPRVELAHLKEVRAKELLVRFALGGAVSIIAGIISKAVSARFGGMFLAFPAILVASLTFVQDKEGTRRADRDAIGAVLGGASLVVFAAVGESMFGRHSSVLVLVASLGAWLVSIAVLFAVLAGIRPDDADARQDRPS